MLNYPIWYTIVDGAEIPLQIQPSDDGRVTLRIDGLFPIGIDTQQLYELGMLLLAIAGTDADYDAASELLDGYQLPYPPLDDIKRSLMDK